MSPSNKLELIPGMLYKTSDVLGFYIGEHNATRITLTHIPKNGFLLFLKKDYTTKMLHGYTVQYFVYKRQIIFDKKYADSVFQLTDYLEKLE